MTDDEAKEIVEKMSEKMSETVCAVFDPVISRRREMIRQRNHGHYSPFTGLDAVEVASESITILLSMLISVVGDADQGKRIADSLHAAVLEAFGEEAASDG